MGLTSAELADRIVDIKTAIEADYLYGAIGTDNTAFTPSDTTLGGEVFRDAIDEVDKSVTDKIVISLRVLTTEANGNTIQEAAFLDAASAGVMRTRNVISPVSKTSDKQLYLDAEITITTEEV